MPGKIAMTSQTAQKTQQVWKKAISTKKPIKEDALPPPMFELLREEVGSLSDLEKKPKSLLPETPAQSKDPEFSEKSKTLPPIPGMPERPKGTAPRPPLLGA